jgi:hypothetical protein
LSLLTPALEIDTAEPKLGQIEFVDKDVNHTNGVVLAQFPRASGKTVEGIRLVGGATPLGWRR